MSTDMCCMRKCKAASVHGNSLCYDKCPCCSNCASVRQPVLLATVDAFMIVLAAAIVHVLFGLHTSYSTIDVSQPGKIKSGMLITTRNSLLSPSPFETQEQS